MTNKNARHYIADESIGGIEREYVEVERKADVGDYVLGKTDTIRKVTEMSYDPVGVAVESITTGDSFGYFTHDFYVVLEPTDIVRIDGDRYRLVNRQAEVGEKILDLYFGEGVFIREVVEPEYASEKVWYTFETEHGEDTAPIGIDEYCVLESIEEEAEPLIVDETQASPQVIDMLANLARRVTQLEEQLSDTQRNVETFAEQTETNSEDIRLLGERDVTIVIKRGDRQ